MAFVKSPVTGNVGVDIDGTAKIPAPPPEPGYFLATQTRPLPVLFQGWLPNGEYSEGELKLSPGQSVQAFYPEDVFIPESAGPSPGAGYRYTVIRVVTAGGWLDAISSYGPW